MDADAAISVKPPPPQRGGATATPEAAAPPAGPDRPERPDVKVLLVDDSPAKLLAMESALTPLGLSMVKALSGREALRHLLEEDFAAILLDVNMPGMDGFETAELIRGRERSAHTPILFVSAISQTDEHAYRGYSLGAVDYIFAPVTPDVLRAKVSVFVELFRQTEEAKRQARRVAERTRQLEASHERLRLSERMAAIGTLSAGLGHDMGNLLLPVQIRLDAMTHKDVSPELLEDVKAIRTCTEYLQRLANGLRLLALDPDIAGASGDVTDLADWWADVAPLLKNALPRGVVLEPDIPTNLPPIALGRAGLTQAVFNLAQNAGDALRARGTGHVRVWARRDEQAPTLRLGVTDDGPGMSAGTAARCFEPFFTTKTRTISTGLGLSLVRATVQKVGGSVHVESRMGEGTTFVLEVPIATRTDVGPAAGARDGAADGSARPVASVSLKDPRLSSYAASFLETLGFGVDRERGEAADGALLWLAEAGDGVSERVRTFLRTDGRRRVVLFGVSHGSGPRSARITSIPDPPRPALIRATVRSIVGDWPEAGRQEMSVHD